MDLQRIARWLVLVAASAVCVPAPAAAGPSRDTVAHWAYVETPVSVRTAPRLGARRTARLLTWTYHGRPETVNVLSWTSDERRSWVEIRYPGLGPRTGWVPARALSRIRTTRQRLVLDRAKLELRLLRNGRIVFRSPVGVGAFGSPTPAGSYYVRERIEPGAPGTVYGALAFGTSAYSPFRTDWPGGGQVGIHGTNQPALIPGRISNGCVRLPDANVLELGRRLTIGTPLEIR